MVEALKLYREQFMQEKLEIETADDEEYIVKMLQEYELKLREELNTKRKEAIAVKEAEIATIDKIIAMETKKLQTEVEKTSIENF